MSVQRHEHMHKRTNGSINKLINNQMDAWLLHRAYPASCWPMNDKHVSSRS